MGIYKVHSFFLAYVEFIRYPSFTDAMSVLPQFVYISSFKECQTVKSSSVSMRHCQI